MCRFERGRDAETRLFVKAVSQAIRDQEILGQVIGVVDHLARIERRARAGRVVVALPIGSSTCDPRNNLGALECSSIRSKTLHDEFRRD